MEYTTDEVQGAALELLAPLEDLGTMASACDDPRTDEWVTDAIKAIQAVGRIAETDEVPR